MLRPKNVKQRWISPSVEIDWTQQEKVDTSKTDRSHVGQFKKYKQKRLS